MMYHGHAGWGWDAWLVMGFMMLAFWGLIAGLVVYVIRSSGHRFAGQPRAVASPEDQAVRILDERFARGEIDVEDDTRRRDLLRGR